MASNIPIAAPRAAPAGPPTLKPIAPPAKPPKTIANFSSSVDSDQLDVTSTPTSRTARASPTPTVAPIAAPAKPPREKPISPPATPISSNSKLLNISFALRLPSWSNIRESATRPIDKPASVPTIAPGTPPIIKPITPPASPVSPAIIFSAICSPVRSFQSRKTSLNERASLPVKESISTASSTKSNALLAPPPPPPPVLVSFITFSVSIPISCFLASLALSAAPPRLSLSLPVFAMAFLNVPFPLSTAKNCAMALAAFASHPISVCSTGITALRIGANAAPQEPLSAESDALSSSMFFLVSGSFSAKAFTASTVYCFSLRNSTYSVRMPIPYLSMLFTPPCIAA